MLRFSQWIHIPSQLLRSNQIFHLAYFVRLDRSLSPMFKGIVIYIYIYIYIIKIILFMVGGGSIGLEKT